jgi:hypothetical protein
MPLAGDIEVEHFLRFVADRLNELPKARLDAERRVLAAEARSRGQTVGGELLSRRFGAHAWGTAGWWELGTAYADHSAVAEWMHRHFTRGSAAVWMTAPPSEGLNLDLPDGERVAAPQPMIAHDGRAWFRFRSPAVAFLCRVQRSHEASVAAGVLVMELQRRLREAGLCYAVASSWSRLDAACATLTVSCDSAPQRESELAAALLAAIDDLATNPPPRVLENLRYERGLARADDMARANLDAFTLDLLLGRPSRTAHEDYVKEQAVTIEAVGAQIRGMRDDMLLAVPEQAIVRHPGVLAYPEAPYEPTPGRRHRYANLYERPDATAALVVGDHGLALTRCDGSTSVRWNDVACVMRWDDGARCVINHRGDAVTVEPTRFEQGADATRAIDAAIGDERNVHIGTHYATPVVPWASKTATRCLSMVRSVVGWGLVAAMCALVYYALVERSAGYGAGALGAAAGLVAWACWTTRRPRPFLWDNTHTRRSAPDTVDRSAWYVPTGVLVGWIAARDRFSDNWAISLGDGVAALKAKEITGPELYRRAGGVLSDDMLTAETNEFFTDFLGQDHPKRKWNYEHALGSAVHTASWYEIPDNWEIQRKVIEQIDVCYAKWRRRYRSSLLRHLRRLLSPGDRKWSGDQADRWAALIVQRWRRRIWR